MGLCRGGSCWGMAYGVQAAGAREVLDVGNTFDARWTPAPGRYLLEVGTAGTPQYWSEVIVAR